MPPRPKHSGIGASGASRWLACPGSVQLSEGLPSKDSPHSLEGDFAHGIAELCLLAGERSAKVYVGQVLPNRNKNPTEVTDEMAEAIDVYLDAVWAEVGATGGTLKVEQEFCLDWISEGAYGTNDAMVCELFGKLTVFDYKHGAGVAVEVTDNPQPMYYAVGALGPSGNGYEEVEIVIVQPRAHHKDGPIRRQSFAPEELLKWANEVLAPGIKATQQENPPLVAGDHCRWCKAKAGCPKLIDHSVEASKAAFTPISGDVVPQLPRWQDLSPREKSYLFKWASVLEEWIKAAKQQALEDLEAGHEIEGLKLVESRPREAWAGFVSAGSLAHHLAGRGINGVATSKTSERILTPKQMAKALELAGYDALSAGLEDLTEKRVTKTITTADDTRLPAKTKAQNAFSILT